MLPGYRIIDLIYEGANTLVYRAQHLKDCQLKIFKLPKSEYPRLGELIELRNHYLITKNLDLDGVVKSYSLEKYGRSLVLVMEDFGGISLQKYVEIHGIANNQAILNGQKTLFLREFLDIALSIATIIEKIAFNGIIHQNITPQNILINPHTKEVKLTNFSHASVVAKEEEWLSPYLSPVNLAYISPEQTGILNRGIDYRTDYYSLGVTFYQLLTGQLPFAIEDEFELIRSHVAVQPIPPQQLNSTIPKAINDIILKLMAKNVQERYQTAFGLRHDLGSCRQQWQAEGNVTEIVLGTRDISPRFAVSEQLYGRETEIESLLTSFERVSQGNTEFILVNGFSGIGKTALISEVRQPIARQQGYFISGKFNQFGRNVPFFALIQAFRDLMRQLLSESFSRLQQWQEQILAGLGRNGQVIIEVIPELEKIIGKQPSVPKLEGSASRNRFNLLFSKFIRVFTTVDHPLVIFLDDLQWADAASLRLMEFLANETDSRYLLLIGAYRHNEVTAAHPLMLTLAAMKRIVAEHKNGDRQWHEIDLPPLDRVSVNRLIADTLSCSEELALPLAKLVFAKTKGNPFFTNQFLQSLAKDQLIFFNQQDYYWQCDLAKIERLSVSDDVVEFMAGRLTKLPEPTLQLLQLAACIGGQFDLETLAIVSQNSPAETAAVLTYAVEEGLILPASRIYQFSHHYEDLFLPYPHEIDEELSLSSPTFKLPYKFLHDRVQQAAYSLIPDTQKQFTHLQIGRLLLDRSKREQGIDEKIFAIVNQLNIGADLIEDSAELTELARLNLIAGTKAKQATAYPIAWTYFTRSIALLTNHHWQGDRELAQEIYLLAAQTAYLVGKFEQMEQFTAILLQQARSLLDRVQVYQVKIHGYIAQGQPIKAVETSLLVLRCLGVHLPQKPSKLRILMTLLQTKLMLHGRAIDSLIELPKMTDPEKLAAGKIMAITSSSSFSTASGLTPLLTFMGVIWSIKYGNDAMSSYGYAGYGVILCGVLEEFSAGYQFGKLALDLVEKVNAKELEARTMMVFHNFIGHWREHLQIGLKPLLDAYVSGLETGDLEFAAYSAYMHCYHSYFAGEELRELANKMETYQEAIANCQQETVLRLHKLYRQVVLNLIGATKHRDRLSGEIYDETKMLPILQQEQHTSALFDLYWHKLMLCYLFGQFDRALENAKLARQYLDGEIATLSVPLFHFYESLACLAVYGEASRWEKIRLIARVRSNQRKLKRWAKTSPMNHLHKFYLVEAEKDRVLNRASRAADDYDRAIKLAKENEYLQEEALSQELAGKFHLEGGRAKIAAAYLHDAYYNYARWGAIAKVRDLVDRYPQLLAPILEPESLPSLGSNSELTNPQLKESNYLTFEEASVSSQNSNQTELKQLLVNSLEAIVVNAGAEKGYLILPDLPNLGTDRGIIYQSDNAAILSSAKALREGELPLSLIDYVERTLEPIVLENATQVAEYAGDTYIKQCRPKSIMCLPICDRDRSLGILYLENNLTSGVFSRNHLPVINLLGAQIAISLENKILHQQLQQLQIEEQEKTARLEKSLADLQEAQNQLIEAQVQLQHGAFHDALTGLPNRAWLMRMLDHAIKLAQRYPNHLYAVLFLDLDRFKVVNDSLGHLVGDELLKSVAQKLQACVRSSDTIARFGGDEFAILLEEMEDEQEATVVAQRIQENLSQPFQLKDYEVCTGTSIGITLSTMGYQQPEELLRDADAAMYHAKSQGKGRYVIFDRGMQTHAMSVLQLENDLRRAIEKQEFCLYYQPIVSLMTGQISGFEALIRWYHRQRGWISPEEFIPIAEETGLIHELGRWILQSACEQLQSWLVEFPQIPTLIINVNFSAIQLKQVDILEQLEAILPKDKRSGFGLKLEITESCILEAVNWEAERLKQLKELGIGLCIDDFGTGYSSLSRLHEFPIDTLKIDRSFVNRLHLNSNHHDIVQMIVTLAHSLGMDVVAEGVESQVQLNKLKQLNCEFAQGYLFSKPLDSKAATQSLKLQHERIG
jgi:diguanylate cyclase (GGDEF)-like protein